MSTENKVIAQLATKATEYTNNVTELNHSNMHGSEIEQINSKLLIEIKLLAQVLS